MLVAVPTLTTLGLLGIVIVAEEEAEEDVTPPPPINKEFAEPQSRDVRSDLVLPLPLPLLLLPVGVYGPPPLTTVPLEDGVVEVVDAAAVVVVDADVGVVAVEDSSWVLEADRSKPPPRDFLFRFLFPVPDFDIIWCCVQFHGS